MHAHDTTTNHRCQVCGRQLDPGTGRVPKQFHDECREYRKYLGAAIRKLEKIEFSNDEDGLLKRQLLRRELFLVLNQQLQPVCNVKVRAEVSYA